MEPGFRRHLEETYPKIIQRAMELVLEGTKYTDLAVIEAGMDLGTEVRVDFISGLSDIVTERGRVWQQTEGVQSFSTKGVTDGQEA